MKCKNRDIIDVCKIKFKSWNNLHDCFWRRFFKDLPCTTLYAYIIFAGTVAQMLRKSDPNIKILTSGWKELDDLAEKISNIPSEISDKKNFDRRKVIYDKLIELKRETRKAKNFPRDDEDAYKLSNGWLLTLSNEENNDGQS